MAKWNLDTIEADMAEIRESVNNLQEINTLQAQTIERLSADIVDFNIGIDARDVMIDSLREQLRQAQQSLRNARDSALEEAANIIENFGVGHSNLAQRIMAAMAGVVRSLKSTTQGSRE